MYDYVCMIMYVIMYDYVCMSIYIYISMEDRSYGDSG